MARDNFPANVIRKLRDGVAHRCSNPACRAPTSAPAEDGNAVINIGKAAHICAASPGGPRYDPAMSPEQRKSFDNGIWLCANDADAIDRDVTTYPVSLLIEWKRLAEEMAKTELGSRLPQAGDATEMLTQALTGLPQAFLPASIENAHKASAGALEKLDPRFSVTSSFDPDRGTLFSLHAKEVVDIGLEGQPEYAHPLAQQYSRLLDHGVGFDVDPNALILEGSPLLKHLSEGACGGAGKLLIGAKPVKAVTKLGLHNSSTGYQEAMDDVHGDLTVGLKSYSFTGMAMGGFLSLSFTRSHDPESGISDLNLKFNFDQWRGTLITMLPWFTKTNQILQAIVSGSELELTLEVNGERISGAAIRLDPVEPARIAALLRYTELARELSVFLGANIQFHDAIDVSSEQIDFLSEAVDASRGNVDVDPLNTPVARLDKMDPSLGRQSAFSLQPEWQEPPLSANPRSWEATIFGLRISMPDMDFAFSYYRMVNAEKSAMPRRFQIIPGLNLSIEYRFDIPKPKRGA